MKKTIIIAFAALAMTIASCGGNKGGDAGSADSESVESAAARSENASANLKSAAGLPMLVDFSAEWCPPCRQMKPTFEALKEVYAGKVELTTIDVDDNSALAEKYNVTSIPTLVYISPEGKELYRTVGLQTEETIKADIAKYLQ